jgi:hypothetical protein
MPLPYTIQQAETRAKLGVQPSRRIPHDLQTATPCRPIRGEARDDNVAPGPHDTVYLRHITGTIARVSEEVKDGSVMPDGTGCGWQWRVENVCNDPPYLIRAFAQSLLRALQSGRCQVEDRDVSVAGTE